MWIYFSQNRKVEKGKAILSAKSLLN